MLVLELDHGKANEIGSEFEIFAEPGFIVLIDIATDTDIDVPLPVGDGATMTITVPKSALFDDDGRLSAVAFVGNSDEPTDCLP